ncbi:transposase [Roseomonas sp. BN140053]|uniref:transposase n=1 Tax=Roseomonas sp. BN140053 TaxID=3391898 RepID=UPI0039E7EB5C
MPHPLPPRPWSPLSDPEWSALLPFVLHRSGPGRPIRDLRARMDAIFHLATLRGAPWHALPARFGKPDTVSRYFRRLTHAGLWERLLHALADTAPNHPLRAIEAWICRAARRAYRIRGMALLLLARRLGFRSALRAPPWMLPDPDLSETLAPLLPGTFASNRGPRGGLRRDGPIRPLMRLLRDAAGRARIPRSVALGWP